MSHIKDWQNLEARHKAAQAVEGGSAQLKKLAVRYLRDTDTREESRLDRTENRATLYTREDGTER